MHRLTTLSSCLLPCYHFMSTATALKLTYAKVGNKSKNKIEAASTQLTREAEQGGEDLFSHMNQDNLNYIKKELKLKKNRSEHDKPRFNNQEERDELQEQVTQRDKIYHKYNKGEEEVSEREPYLEDTQRKSSEDKPVNIHIADDVEEELQEIMQQGQDRKGLSISHNGERVQAFTKIPPEGKMYQSLPYEQPKTRMVSIEREFRESVSTNLQKYREDGQLFIENLEDYISDLKKSQNAKSSPQDEQPMERLGRSGKPGVHKESEQSDDRIIREDLRKMQRLKRNSDTFGEPNSKYTAQSISYDSNIGYDLQQQLKQERFNCLMLAKDMETLHKELSGRDAVVKNLQLQNELLREEITHLKAKQDIILKNKGEPIYESRPLRANKQPRRPNDENFIDGFNDYNHFILSHHRHGSVNPSAHRNGYSSRENPSFHPQQTDPPNDFNQTLFKQFEESGKMRETPRKDSKSIQKLQQEYSKWMEERNASRKSRKVHYK